MNRKLVAGIAAAILAGTAGIAQADDYSGWYVGANLGRSDVKIGGGGLDHVFANQGLTTSSSLEKHHSAYSLNLGYQVNPYFAVEGAYVDLGKHGFDANVSAPVSDTLSGHFRARGYSLSAVGILPVGQGWAVYGKAGALRARTQLDESSGGAVAASSATDNGTDATYGLGVSYDFTDNVAGRLEWNRYHNVGDSNVTGEGNINLLTAGLTYRF